MPVEAKPLIRPDAYAEYPYTGCLVPGDPELKPFEKDYWERFWRIYSHLCENGLQARAKNESAE